MIVWKFGAGIRVRVWIIGVVFEFGIGRRFGVGVGVCVGVGSDGGGGGGVGLPAGFAVGGRGRLGIVAAGHPAAVN